MRKKKPKFIRQGGVTLKRVGEKWRKPRGHHSKLRKHKKHRGFIPSTGYGTPRDIRGLHPCGLEEVLVFNVKDIEKLIPEKQACKIGRTVGRKKRIEIVKIAKQKNIKVLNPQRAIEKKRPKEEPKKEEKKPEKQEEVKKVK